ncbi:hypothetical protein SCHPADRAFT_45633 [Schizopora paradoxa]|uniref:Uncharacterized protein n=1 Tax=Schizopora paradoxa TaxID=27342 RepID=A0A0H2S7J7_9AGAM|nr:hypothetical protein SCHPADRAFT_45633 [Schizopora paradoxa]
MDPLRPFGSLRSGDIYPAAATTEVGSRSHDFKSKPSIRRSEPGEISCLWAVFGRTGSDLDETMFEYSWRIAKRRAWREIPLESRDDELTKTRAKTKSLGRRRRSKEQTIHPTGITTNDSVDGKKMSCRFATASPKRGCGLVLPANSEGNKTNRSPNIYRLSDPSCSPAHLPGWVTLLEVRREERHTRALAKIYRPA